MRLLYCLAVLLPLLMTAPAEAEFYKYTDKNDPMIPCVDF